MNATSSAGLQDALDEVDAVTIHGRRTEHHAPHISGEHEGSRSSVDVDAASLDPDPLMRAAAELLAENAAILAERTVAT